MSWWRSLRNDDGGAANEDGERTVGLVTTSVELLLLSSLSLTAPRTAVGCSSASLSLAVCALLGSAMLLFSMLGVISVNVVLNL